MPRIELSSISPIEMTPGYLARLIHAERMSLNFVEARAGYVVAEHSHPHEQVSIVIEGEFELKIEREPVRLNPGTLIVIPSNAKHSGVAITDSKLPDVFSPVREDYRALDYSIFSAIK